MASRAAAQLQNDPDVEVRIVKGGAAS